MGQKYSLSTHENGVPSCPQRFFLFAASIETRNDIHGNVSEAENSRSVVSMYAAAQAIRPLPRISDFNEDRRKRIADSKSD
jgi:hypothetical protein